MKVKLTEICTPKQWKTIPTSALLEDGYPVYGANGIIGYYEEYNHEEPVIAITCRGATCGTINLTVPKAYVTGNAMCLDNVCTDVLPEYLYFCLLHYDFDNIISGSAQPQITRQGLAKVEIELYSLTEQRKIIDSLRKVKAIIDAHKSQLQKLDELIKARFVELFGDPKVNPFGWDTTLVRDVVASCEAGWSGNGTQREKEDGEIAVLKVSAVTKGYFIPEECKVLDDQDTIKKYVYPQAGDLLFSRANTREMVGATAVITRDYPEHILPDKLWKIRFLGKANVWYMKYVLSSESIRSIFSSVSTGTSGSMFNVSMDKFKSIRVPLPPIARQQQFASFVNQVDKSKLLCLFYISYINNYSFYGII